MLKMESTIAPSIFSGFSVEVHELFEKRHESHATELETRG